MYIGAFLYMLKLTFLETWNIAQQYEYKLNVFYIWNWGVIVLNDFKLDSYLTKDYILKSLGGKKVNDLPEMEPILVKARRLLEENRMSNQLMGGGQLYDQRINFDRENYCTLTWDIERAKIICSELGVPVINLKVDELRRRMSPDAIEEEYVKKGLKNDEPIIVASLPMISSYVVIDGNHRVESRYRKNIRAVKGYCMETGHHYFAMPNDTSRALFFVLTVVENIRRYLKGQLSKQELMMCASEIEPDKFYQVSVQKEFMDMLGGGKK